jgi:hypothetical protein
MSKPARIIIDNSKLHMGWKQSELRHLREMHADGLMTQSMAIILKRSQHSIRAKLIALDIYAPHAPFNCEIGVHVIESDRDRLIEIAKEKQITRAELLRSMIKRVIREFDESTALELKAGE